MFNVSITVKFDVNVAVSVGRHDVVSRGEDKVRGNEEASPFAKLIAVAEQEVADAVVGEGGDIFALDGLDEITETCFVAELVSHLIFMLLISTDLYLTSNLENQRGKQNIMYPHRKINHGNHDFYLNHQ